MTTNKNRLLLLLGAVAFTGLYQWVYISWLSPTFGYMGFSYEKPAVGYMALAWVLCVAPSLWMPIALRRPSQICLWILYLAVFVPSMFIPLYTAYQPLERVAALMLTLFVGFALTCVGSYLPLFRMRAPRISMTILLVGIGAVTLLLVGWVAVVFHGHLRFVSFGNVYEDIRFSGAEVASGTGVGYAVMLLSGALHPFFMAWGLTRKRPLLFALGALGQLLLYCTAGLKIILLSTVLIPLLYMAMAGQRAETFGLRFTFGAVFLFAVLNFINQLVGELNPSHLMLSALVFLRTFGMTGLTTAQYHDFFSEHPLTYFSHVHGVDLLVEYPYSSPIGKEVGYFYSSNVNYNANAHFWCTDGLAGLGLFGVILISVLCALVFWLLDSAAAKHTAVCSSLMVTFAAFNLSNVSLFTTLLSGGLGTLILVLYLAPGEAEPEAETKDEGSSPVPEGELLPEPSASVSLPEAVNPSACDAIGGSP
jgi:hypothetical protein